MHVVRKILSFVIVLISTFLVSANAQEITFRLDSTEHIIPGMPLREQNPSSVLLPPALRNLPEFKMTGEKFLLPDFHSHLRLDWKNEFIPRSIDAEKSHYMEGEYHVGAPIWTFRNSYIYGMGVQRNMIGIGRFNAAAIGYSRMLGDRLMINVNINTNKYSMPRFGSTSLGTAASLSYFLNERTTLNVFGSYTTNLNHPINFANYGASLSYDITERFGVEVGMNRYFDPISLRWTTVPIVSPYVRLNNNQKIGFDVGGLLKSAYQKWGRKPSINVELGGPSPTNMQRPRQFVPVVGGNPALPGSYMPRK